jgi:hypothetical protein
MRGAVLAATLALAISLAACGGGEEGTSGRAAAPVAGATTAAPLPAGEDATGPGSDAGSRDRDSSPPAGESVSSRSAPFRGSSGPLKNLPEYGVEAGAGQREQAQLLLTGYLDAVTTGEWGTACGYLAPEFLVQIRQLVGGAGELPSGWCAEALPAYITAAGRAPAELRDYIGIEVASLRVEGDAAFALIHGDGGEDLWVAMKLRDGKWKLLTPMPQRL